MKYIVLFYIIYLFFEIKYIHSEKSYLRFRNSLLRIYIENDKETIPNDYDFKIINKNKNNIHVSCQSTLSKHYDINLIYNSLIKPENDFVYAVMLLIV